MTTAGGSRAEPAGRTASVDEIITAVADGCPHVRPAGPADAIAGVAPVCVAFPTTVGQAAAALRAAATLGLAVVPRGSGSRQCFGAPPHRCDLVVDTTRMDQVIEHAAGDLVVRVQAGVTLGRLAAALGTAGQRLALDGPPSATVGGLLATGAAGPLRLRYGTPRDLLIGVTMVRADGRIARSGGKVVKNVAGYDLGKLLTGSYGTLGLIADATFRLHPAPAARAFVTTEYGRADRSPVDAGTAPAPPSRSLPTGDGTHAAAGAVTAAAGSPLVPSAVEIDVPWPGGPVRVGVLLEGTERGVAERAARMTGLLDGFGGTARVADDPPPWWGRCGEASSATAATGAGGGTVIRVAFWSGTLRRVLAAIEAAACDAGVKPAVGGCAGAGVLHATVDRDTDPDQVAGFVTALRASIGGGPGAPSPAADRGGLAGQSTGARDAAASSAVPPIHGSVVMVAAPPAVRAAVDPWGPVPALDLMRAVKDQFDPEHRLAPGRFAGGI